MYKVIVVDDETWICELFQIVDWKQQVFRLLQMSRRSIRTGTD